MLGDVIREWKRKRRVAAALAELEGRTVTGRPHGLPAPLVVSLTSYPARFGTLALTLRAVLRQTVQADRVVLWLAAGDVGQLPPEVLALKAEGLEIGLCEDIRSFKKIVPTLRETPESFILTADDDIAYGPTWVEDSVAAVDPSRPEVICHRARRILLQADGQPVPYVEWESNIGPAVGPLVFSTGVSGVLYPPGVFHPDTCKAELFRELTPAADDVWLWWMYRMTGAVARKVGPPQRIVEWPGSQVTQLRQGNVAQNGNDRQIAAMIARYGFPG